MRRGAESRGDVGPLHKCVVLVVHHIVKNGTLGWDVCVCLEGLSPPLAERVTGSHLQSASKGPDAGKVEVALNLSIIQVRSRIQQSLQEHQICTQMHPDKETSQIKVERIHLQESNEGMDHVFLGLIWHNP